MAPRVLLLCFLFTIGLQAGLSKATSELNLTLEFDQEPQNVVAVRGKPLVLQCAASSSSPGPVYFNWTHEDKPLVLVNDTRRSILSNGSLYFKKVLSKRGGSAHEGTSDLGEYRCVVRNSLGALVSRYAQLRIATLSHNFSVSPHNITTEENDITRFMCQIESVPNALISWERNGKPLPQNSRYFTLESGVLYITKVQPSDAGTYRCVAENPLATKKPRVSSEGHLEVLPKSPFPQAPEFLTVNLVIEAKENENITLDCAAIGSPVPELSWTFLPRTPGSKQQLITNATRTGMNIVTLERVTAVHSGVYTCTAINLGPDKTIEPIMQTVSVEVLEPPKFVKEPTSQIYLTAKTVRFECEVKGNKTTDIVWLKNGKRLQINGRIKQRQTELVLSNTVTDDSGLYQCMARNKVGENWVAGRLLVNTSRTRPDPPHGLMCRTLSDSQVKLDCKEPPKFANNITAYTIHYFPAEGGEERQEVSINCSFLVQKLSAFTNYTFYVRAYSSKSASDQSKLTYCHTGEGVPLAAPQLTLKAISPTSLRVSWVPLSKKKAQGVVTEYKIQWRRKTQPTIRVEQVKGDLTDYTITELHPGKRYEVRVLAATSKGWPSQQDEFEWTDEETPNSPQNVPQAPTVHLTVVNSSSIEVTWSIPPENKYKPNGFRLYYRKMNSEKKLGPISLTANTTQFLLGDLDPDSWYEVFVHGYNEEGVGEFGLKAIYTLPTSGSADVTAIPSMGLEPPTNLEAEPTSPNSINLTWTPPQSAMNVSYYTVCYGQVQSTFAVNSTYVSSTSHGVEVSYLKPYTLYEFKVRTHDHNNQHGPYSQKVECGTLEDVPSAVLGVQWRVLNSSTIHVTWKEPQHTNGVIKYYEIMFDRDSGGSADHVRSVNASNSKLNTEVTNLEPNRRYFMSVRAVTRAGSGPPSDKVTVTIPVVMPNTPVSTPQPPAPGIERDQHLGIVVGVAIAVGFIILCAIVIVWRRHCIKSASPECSAGGGTSCGSGGHHANGSGYYREWDRSPASQAHIMATAAPTEIHEMDYFTSVITTHNIPCDTHADHLDTKGGYPNGQVNGLKHPLLTNGRIPNGQALRDRNSVRIIENPQFNRGDAGDQRHLVVVPVTKSRSSHLHSDRRSGTGGEEEIQLLADHNTPLLSLRREETPLRGNETSLQLQASHGSSENKSSSRDRLREDDVSLDDNDLDATQVASLDLSLDGSSEGGNRSSHHLQQHQQQQHSPHQTQHHHHHHHHHHHQEPHNNPHHPPHPSNSSHDSHNRGSTSLHHIDNITGTTTTRSQFHPQTPPHNELFHSQAAISPQNDLLLNQ